MNRNFGNFGSSRSFVAPVKVGDEFDVKIEAVGEKGDGIAKKDGFVIFVPNTKQGDEVRIKVTRVLRRVGFGEVVGGGSSPQGEEAPAEEGYSESEESDSTKEEAGSKDTEDFGEDLEE